MNCNKVFQKEIPQKDYDLAVDALKNSKPITLQKFAHICNQTSPTSMTIGIGLVLAIQSVKDK